MGRFTMELLARSENNKERCSYYDVSEDGDGPRRTTAWLA